MLQLTLKRGLEVRRKGGRLGRETWHFLLRQLWEQRHEDVNHQACSGTPTQVGVQRKGGCCARDKARGSEQAQAWGALWAVLSPENTSHVPCCLPPVQGKPDIYQMASSPDLLPGPWTLSWL